MSEIACPHCNETMHIEAVAAVGEDQRFTYSVHPLERGQPMQAEAIGGQLVALDKMMRAIAKEDGGKVRTYIEGCSMDEDGKIEFKIAVLAVKPIRKPKQGDFPLSPQQETR